MHLHKNSPIQQSFEDNQMNPLKFEHLDYDGVRRFVESFEKSKTQISFVPRSLVPRALQKTTKSASTNAENPTDAVRPVRKSMIHRLIARVAPSTFNRTSLC